MRKILVSSQASLFPPEHGGAKNIQCLLESFSANGIECRVLVKMQPEGKPRTRFAGQHRSSLDDFDIQFKDHKQEEWTYANISYRGIKGESSDLAKASKDEIETFTPDFFILCDDSLDAGQEIFEVATQSDRFIFFAQTIHSLPFGPYSMKPSAVITDCIRKAKKIIAPSQYVKTYIENSLNKATAYFYPNVFGNPPFAKLGSYHNPFVTIINPCPWKGSSILINLAKLRSDISFAAVPTWGATPELISQLNALPNMTLLEETSDIDQIFSQTRVLLVPSLCQEAFGLVSPEAMLRGIPVIASDVAGLRESTLDAATLIPVIPLAFDGACEGTDHTKFVWNEPENPVEPWSMALDRILDNESYYNSISYNVRNAAQNFVSNLNKRSALQLLYGSEELCEKML